MSDEDKLARIVEARLALNESIPAGNRPILGLARETLERAFPRSVHLERVRASCAGPKAEQGGRPSTAPAIAPARALPAETRRHRWSACQRSRARVLLDSMLLPTPTEPAGRVPRRIRTRRRV
jgi:hypothetical protein